MADNYLHWIAARELDPSSSQNEYSALTDVPIFLGYVFSFLLQGILVVQIFIYFVSFSSTDPRYMKVTAALVFFIDCLSSIFALYAAIWSIVVNGYLVQMSFLWGFRAIAALCGVVTLVVQGFYSWRIHLLKGHWIIPTVIMLLSVAQCCAVMYSGFTSPLGIGQQPSRVLFSINILWLLGSAVCDFTISFSLLILLRRATAHLKTSRARSALGKVMTVAIETGMITALGACIELVFYVFLTNSYIHFILFFNLPKLYANCMMATLNARLDVPGRRFRESVVEWLNPNSAGELQTGSLLSSLESGEVLDICRNAEVTNYRAEVTNDSSEVKEIPVELHATQRLNRPLPLQHSCAGFGHQPELPGQMAGSRRMTVSLPLRSSEPVLKRMSLA